MTGVEVVEVRSEGLVGLFCHPRDGTGPGVIALGGSDGGIPNHVAKLLAEEGLCCLALGYFGAPGLPAHLVEIRLDYVERAVEWLRAQRSVAAGRVGVMGVSKGAELALLSAATFPQGIAAVVAYAPSSVAFPGISLGRQGRRRSSWSFRGQPLPFVPYPRRARPALRMRGFSLAPIYQRALDAADTQVTAEAAIPLERADADILLLSGGKDSIWPASTMAEELMDRLSVAGKAGRAEHVHFPGAGHSFMPWKPSVRWDVAARALDEVRLAGIGFGLALGGRPSANRRALHESWERVVPFLQESLASPNESSAAQPPL